MNSSEEVRPCRRQHPARRFISLTIGSLVAATVVALAAPAAAATAFSGRIVDSWTGVGLSGVTVVVAEIDGTPVPGAEAVTAADGSFSIAGLDGEEYAVQVDARAQGYERGWVGSPNGQPFGKPVLQGLAESITWAPQSLAPSGSTVARTGAAWSTRTPGRHSVVSGCRPPTPTASYVPARRC